MLFEPMQVDTKRSKNYYAIFYNVKLEHRERTLTWNNKSHAQN